MDAAEYRETVNRPDVLSRNVLTATAQVLKPIDLHLALRIEDLLRGEPLPKPAARGADEDHFRLDLAEEDLEAIVETLFVREASVSADERSETAHISAAADLADTWNAALIYRRNAAA